MNSYEKIYNLLTEAKITLKKKDKSTRPTAAIYKSGEAAIKTGDAEAKQRSGQTKLKKTLKHERFKAGQRIFGKYKGFVPGTPESRPIAASERENLARQGMVPPRVGGRTRRGMR